MLHDSACINSPSDAFCPQADNKPFVSLQQYLTFCVGRWKAIRSAIDLWSFQALRHLEYRPPKFKYANRCAIRGIVWGNGALAVAVDGSEG